MLRRDGHGGWISKIVKYAKGTEAGSITFFKNYKMLNKADV